MAWNTISPINLIVKGKWMVYTYLNKLIENCQYLYDNMGGTGGGGDMYKAEYDPDDDGVVIAADIARALDGAVTGSYVTAEEVSDAVNVLPNLMLSSRLAGNVKNYGAKGDGSTDDTTAIQNALNAHLSVYFPSGNYISKKLVPIDGQVIFGDGYSSQITLKTGETSTSLFDGTAPAVNVRYSNLRLYGGVATSFKAVTSAGNRNGITVASQKITKIDNVIISGFDLKGINTYDPARDRLTHLSIMNCEIYNCYEGVFLDADYAEYIRLNNLDIYGCREGLTIESGNNTVSNCKINDCYYGVLLYGNTIANNGHGNLVGCLLNHNTYPVWCQMITIGYNIVGCNMFEGSIYFNTSTGINVSGCVLDLDAYYFDGGGRNCFSNNFIYNGYANTINHNYNSHTDNTIFINNYKPDGTTIDENVSQTITGQLKKTKIINIGDWNMDSSTAVAIAHGLTRSKILSVDILIFDDANTYSISIFGSGSSSSSYYGGYFIDNTNINIVRTTSGYFDSTEFDVTSYNRGVITIEYLV
jgi:hypothetical protein